MQCLGRETDIAERYHNEQQQSRRANVTGSNFDHREQSHDTITIIQSQGAIAAILRSHHIEQSQSWRAIAE